LTAYNWHAVSSGEGRNRIWYAFRQVWIPERKVKQSIAMHRVILPPPSGFQIDHRNNNGLDNRRANLRIATPAQNARNARKYSSETSSRYKGVYWDSSQYKWLTQISIDGKQKLLGCFESELDAALTYDRTAKKHFGEFAWLNFA